MALSFIRWAGLDPATVELAIKSLILEMRPYARPVDGRGGDGGRDVRWDSDQGLVIFEIKSYAARLTKGQKAEIEKSLVAASAHAPVRWILVQPLDHSPAEETWFDGLNASYGTIALEWWGLVWLNNEFGKREYLRRFVEGESYELLKLAQRFDKNHVVLAGGIVDVVAQVSSVLDRSDDLSPFWKAVVTASPGEVHTSFQERYPGAAALDPVTVRADYSFPPDDAAAEKTRRLLEDFQAYGGDVEVDGRYVAGFDVGVSPASMALFTVEGETRSLRFMSLLRPLDPDVTCQLVAVSNTGRVRGRLVLQMQPPTAGKRGVRVRGTDATGTISVVMTVDSPESGGAFSLQIEVKGMVGRYPYAIRPAYDIFRHLDDGGSLELRINDQNVGVPEQKPLVPSMLRLTADFVAALEQLQSHTGLLFPIPIDVADNDANDIIFAATLLAGEQKRSGDTLVNMTLRGDRLAEFLELGLDKIQGALVIESPLYSVSCGPHDLPLGRVNVTAPRIQLTNLDHLRSKATSGVDAVANYTCIDGEGIYYQLVPQSS